MIPGLALDRRKPRELLVTLRRGPDQHDVALFGQHDEVIAGEHELAVAVSTALPLQLARRGVDAGEDRFVQPVDVAVVQHGLVNLFFIRLFCPDRRASRTDRRFERPRTRAAPWP